MKKKIFKLSAIFCLSVFFFSLTIPSHASVADGRASLFNDGSPTYSGILAANEQFEAAVTDNPLDQEANLFYAITRILASGLEEGGAAELETVRDLLEAFGVSRNDVDLVDTDVPFNDPPLMYDEYNPPETIPGGEDVRAFLAGPFVTLLGAAIDNLGTIGSDFITTLTAAETGDDYATEVDYGDVLLLKSALYMLKSTILIATAYDLDIDLRELIVFGNAGVLQFQRDLLDKYPALFSLRAPGGTVSLANAKTALLAGINAYDAALTFIENESDLQGNDLFYFESSGDQREAEFVLTQLTELRDSLGENQAAVFTTIYEEWLFTDTSTDTKLHLRADIEKDVNENFVSGNYWGLNGCDFISCSGWIEDISVSGTSVTIEVAYGGWPSGSAIFTGETNDEGTFIEGTYIEYDGLGDPTGGRGFFTATRQSRETETETIDFNCIFGNNTTPVKSPLDIRAILPQFDQYGEPIADTFPVPVLNGILPEFTTNQDLTDEMGLQPAAVNTSSISGTITCSAYSEPGNIFVWAYDGPDWRFAHRLGGAVAEASGDYTIEGLAVGANVYLFARWDADDNGIKTFGDYWGRNIESVEVTSGGTLGADFSTDTQIDDSYIMTKPGVYRVFASNAYVFPEYYYGSGNPNEMVWNQNEWNFIGESNKTETFNATQYYKTILMIWHENASFNFDAFEDLTAETAFATKADFSPSEYNWRWTGLRNFDADQWTEPSYFKGHPDGLYANTTEWYGFNLFTMPDDGVGSRQLKITLILKGDVDGDGDVDLGDAILALKVAAGLSPEGINLNADVNGDGKIGLAEFIYILQYIAGLRP